MKRLTALFFLILIIPFNEVSAVDKKIDSLKYKEISNIIIRGNKYLNQQKLNEALASYHKADSMASQLNYLKLQASSKYNLGIYIIHIFPKLFNVYI